MRRIAIMPLVALLGCNTSPELGLEIRVPDDKRLFASIDTLNLAASRDNVVLAQQSFAPTTRYVSLRGVSHGERTVVSLDGVDASGRVIAHGATCPANFTSAGLTEPLYFAPTNFFAPTANAPLTERRRPIAAALPDQSVLVAAGADASGVPLASTEQFTVGAARFTAGTTSLAVARARVEALSLPDIGVLFVGGVDTQNVPLARGELYYAPSSASLAEVLPIDGLDARVGHNVVRLADGRALVVGGVGSDGKPLATTSLVYVLDDGTYQVSAGPPLATARSDAATIVATSGGAATGVPLVFGGYDTDGVPLATIELLDVGATVAAPPIGSLVHARAEATASLLDGAVLIVGGRGIDNQPLGNAELFDPFTRKTTVYSLAAARYGHTATVLADGRVLVAGGYDASGNALSSVELFAVGLGFVTERALSEPRADHAALELCDGTVLFTGGAATAELYTEPSQ